MSSGFEGLLSLLNPEEGSFLQSQTSFLFGSEGTTPFQEQVYVNPKNTWSLSLDMCNETLGDETGSCIDPNLDEYAYLMLENKNSNMIGARKARKYCKRDGVLPPPLTSMNGGLRVEARREGGRLVITASNFCGIYFKSERENGRLRLFLVKRKIDEKVEKDGEKHGCKREVGEYCKYNGGKKIPSLPLCLAFS